MIPNRRLLILSCSRRKRSDPGLLPAMERYDGPSFRVLRKFLREYPLEAQSLDIYILSAEFGLLSGGQPIPNYDRRMTSQRASELQPRVLATLKDILVGRPYNQLFISAGKDYLQLLTGYTLLIAADLKVTIPTGTQGRKLAELRDWLHGGPPRSLPKRRTNATQRSSARIRGIEIILAPEQVLGIARQALAKGQGHPTRYQTWYVQVDDQRVAPKWLVSQLTGLPASAFVTDEARRVLEQLGIKVIRV